MEVHAHTHTERKKWTHYFWEFFMLFLAVTAGFFVENQREHFIENKREIEYIKTLSEDVRNNITDLNKGITGFRLFNSHMDTLISFLKSNGELEKNVKAIYQQAVWLHYYYKLTYFDRTIEQLKNSGSFRLIQKKKVSLAVMEFDRGITNLATMQANYVFQNKEKLLDLSNNIFKTNVAKQWITDENWLWHEIELPESPYFLTTEKEKIERFINQLYHYTLITSRFIGSIRNWALVKAEKLDSLIKVEYNMK